MGDRLALMALLILGFATAIGWLELLSQGRLGQLAGNQAKNRCKRAWALVAIAVVVAAGVAVQSWFRPGTTLGGGDVVVPNGTAWIARLFDPWIWGGSTLGEPSQMSLRLPWAAIVSLVHVFGGDPGVAERIFDTALYAGAGLAALALLASFRMGPVVSLTGTLAYLFNPYVFTWVSPYDVYIATLFLLPAIPALLVAAGTGRLSVWWSAALIAAASPLIGFAFSEPPLVGMILAAALSAPLLVAWIDGKDAAIRTLRALLLAIPLLLATSAYWMVPAILHLSEAHLSSSAVLLGFNWTAGELRTTIHNAFWLNTRWFWIAPEYFPYAKAYDALPLSALRFVLPALAFSALGLAGTRRGERGLDRERSLRLAVVVATVALLLILLSTGTKPPGNIVFNRIYNLPYGWLLQEPERFLMVVGLAYGILIAIVIDGLLDHPSITGLMSSHRLTFPTLRISIVPVTIGAVLAVGFPLYTGALVPDTGPPLPIWANHARAQHVNMPAYWPTMAQFADALPIQGSVLVMPPDDFYEMPYTWYYGADVFIPELFKRHVLIPSYPPSELVDSVNLTGQSILHRDWQQVEALVTALNAPLILVRRDVVAPYPNHSILSPGDLAKALETAPNFVLVQQFGPLELFSLRNPTEATDFGAHFSTINTQTPDLRLLSVLPVGEALVSGEPRAGVPNIVQAPPLHLWQVQGDNLVWQPLAPSGFAYRVAELGSRTVVPLDRAGTFIVGGSNAQIVYSPSRTYNTVTVSLKVQSASSNGEAAASFALLADPPSGPAFPTQLVVVHSSFSTKWQGPTDGNHVLVDGMLNGWLIPTGSGAFTANYTPANAFTSAEWISIGAYLLMLLVSVWTLATRSAGMPGGRWRSVRKPGETQEG